MSAPFFRQRKACCSSKLISKIQLAIDPITADAGSAVSRSGRHPVTETQVLSRSIDRIVQVRRVVPQQTRSDAHPRSDEVINVPFPKQDSIAMELSVVDAAAPRRCRTRNIRALKVRAEQN